jgi:serine/threonine-protein kinase
MSQVRYQALGPLQAGEGSRAFLGLEIQPDGRADPVVIVWVPELVEKDSDLLAKVRRETEHAAKLEHPNIVRVAGFGRLEEGHARIVEFADGESLRKILELAKKLPPRIATKIIIDACTGTHYAHVAGNDDGVPLVHGDLRPETILISFNGVTKVSGYGALAFAPRELGGQRVKGRRVYSAPEQIIGGREAITIPTDVYLLGLALYECLTGVVPWADQGDFFDHAVLTLPLPPPPPGDVPEALQKVIEKACNKKALARYPTPLALREALEAAAGADIATNEELAKFLTELFPQSHDLRAARRHTIDAGIADYARRQWADAERRRTSEIPIIAPPPPAAVAPVPVAPAPAPAPRPAPVAVQRSAPPPDDDDEEEPRSSSLGWVLLAALFVAALGGWWGWERANAPLVPPPPEEHVSFKEVVAALDRTPARLPPPTPTVVDGGSADAGLDDAGVPTDAGSPADAGPTRVTAAEGPDAGSAIDAGAAPLDAGPAAPLPQVEVSIECTPEVDVVFEGKVLGRTPWKGQLPQGKRTVTLQNKELGIATQRTLQLKDAPVEETVKFEKGAISIKAPDGAGIFIDGRKVATAPVTGELTVYEGFHRIQVALGQAKWNETFTISTGTRLSFNVELE